MKKIIVISILIEIMLFIGPCYSISGTISVVNQSAAAVNIDMSNNTNEIINTQKENLNISDFVKEAEKYTKESMPGIDIDSLLSSAISGSIDNVKLAKLLWSLFGKEVMNSAAILASVIVIVVIH